MKRKNVNRLFSFLFLMFLSAFLFSGCSSKNTLDTNLKEPQVVVNPDTIRLGVATLAKTQIVFNGSGFTPGESILIEMLNVPVEDQKIELAIANAQVGDDGTFVAEVGTITKISEFMRAQIDAINNVIIITGQPMPVGTYDVRVSSLMSKNTAKCTLTVEGPSIIDRLKDWLGEKLGKIVRKEKSG
jgi:hypothetical protein